MRYHKDGFIFVAPSKRKGKKYDVYDHNNIYITSFGALNMQHYKDRIGHYSELDHNDKKRLKAFNSRFARLIKKRDPFSAMYYSSKYLW